MAAGEVSEKEVKNAIKECNNDCAQFGGDKDLKNELSILKIKIKSLAEVWQTESGEENISALNHIISDLDKYVKDLDRAQKNIRKQEYYYNKSRAYKETKHL